MLRQLRFSIGDLLLATFLAALPLACVRWTGAVTACALSLMSMALTFGYGQISLALMCGSLLTAVVFNDNSATLSACVTVIALTTAIALVLHFTPKQRGLTI